MCPKRVSTCGLLIVRRPIYSPLLLARNCDQRRAYIICCKHLHFCTHVQISLLCVFLRVMTSTVTHTLYFLYKPPIPENVIV